MHLERRKKGYETQGFINHAHWVHDGAPAGRRPNNTTRAGADQTDLRQLPPCPHLPLCPDGEREGRGGEENRWKGGDPNLPGEYPAQSKKHVRRGNLRNSGHWLFGYELPTRPLPPL